MPAKKQTEPKPTEPTAEGDAPEPTVTAQAAGKSWTVPVAAYTDFEVLDDLGRWGQGDLTRMPSAVRRLLGNDQYDEAMTALRDPKTGRVSSDAGSDFLVELLAGFNPNS